MKEIKIKDSYITLGQLLKHCNYISSGAEAKDYLVCQKVLVNDEPENRRGRKLYPNDIITINSDKIYVH